MPSKLSMVIIAQALRIELGWLTAGAGPMELPEKNVDGAPISEPPVSYNALTEGDRVIVEIFKELIDSGDSDVLDHLRRQLTLLRELLERRRGRES